jgi:hypothetical protein
VVTRPDGIRVVTRLAKPLFPYKFRPYWNPARALETILLVGYLVILWIGWIAKYFGERERAYAEFLTNWSWTLQTLTYTFKIVSYIDPSGTLLYLYYTVLFWPMATTAWGVFVLVTFVLQDNPNLLAEMFEDYGAGNVLLANTIYHYVPPVMVLIFIFLSYKDHRQILWLRPWGIAIHMGWQLMVSQFPVLIYASIYDFTEVYGLKDLSWWQILLLYEIGCVIAWLLAFLLVISPIHNDKKDGGYIPAYVAERMFNAQLEASHAAASKA